MSSGPLFGEEGRTFKSSPFAFRVKSQMKPLLATASSHIAPRSVHAAKLDDEDLTWFHSDGGANGPGKAGEGKPGASLERLEREVLDVIAQRDLSPPWRIASARPVCPSSPLRRPVLDKGHRASAPPPTEREITDGKSSSGPEPPSLLEAAAKAAGSEEETYPFENDENINANGEFLDADKFALALEQLSSAWKYFENEENTITQPVVNHRPLQNPKVKRHLFTSSQPASPLRPIAGPMSWNRNLLPDLAVAVE